MRTRRDGLRPLNAIPSDVQAKMISEILQITIGVLLLAFGSNFAALWHKLRGSEESGR